MKSHHSSNVTQQNHGKITAFFDSLSRSGRGCWKVASPTSSISSLIYIIVKWAENGWRMVAVGEAKLTIPEYSANLCDTCRPKYHRTSIACCWHPIARGNSHIFGESTCWVARRSYPNWSPTTGDETGYDCHDMLKNHGKKTVITALTIMDTLFWCIPCQPQLHTPASQQLSSTCCDA